MKVLFLDIDGVLNSERVLVATNKLIISYTVAGKVYEYTDFGFDPICVKLLQKACEDLNLKIVISSTWGEHISLDEFHYIFSCYGFNTSEIIIGKISHENLSRGIRVKNWLTHNPEYTEYCILDDSKDFLPEQIPSSVFTDPDEGMSFKNFQDIYKAFGQTYTPQFILGN